MNFLQTTFSLKVIIKGIGAVPIVLAYLATAAVLAVLPVTGRFRRILRVRSTSFFSRPLLVLLGVSVRMNQRDRLHSDRRGRLIIANHVSYLDVLVLSAILPCVFITSVELRHTPLLGLLARSGGSLFVERRKRTGLKQEIEHIARVLGQGFSVVLFPEGTTSNGDRVQQFKKSLFDAAVWAKADLLPVCLRYTGINKKPVSARNRDALFYYGGVRFSRHFQRLLSLESIEVDVIPLKTIRTGLHASRKDLAIAAHDAIAKAYHG